MNKSIRHKGAKVRMCAACGGRFPKDAHDFIRIACAKDGTVSLNRGESPEGRGAYVCREAECVKRLCKSRRLARLLRNPVPDEIYAALRSEVGLDE